MKKQLIILLGILCLSLSSWAQKEYKLSKNSGRLNLNINGAIVEGYNGNEIIFTTQKDDNEDEDQRAKGLKSINGSGFSDNTGLGISVVENGQDINVNSVSKNNRGIISIKVPQNVKVSFSNNSSIYNEELILRNLKNEIEVSVSYNKIKLENNSGPMNIKSIYGSIDASFDQDIKGPVSIISVYSYVDVSLPASTKANLELGTSYGKLYAADNFKITLDNNSKNTDKEKATKTTTTLLSGSNTSGGSAENTFISINNGQNFTFATTGSAYKNGENIKGTINGGGINLIFKSTYKNVYLRNK